jgi:hypothetical protein
MATDPAFDRRIGWLAVLGGGLLALAVQVGGPVGVPLYDGVVIQEPYRFLHPVGDQAGDPSSASSTPAVTDAESPLFAAATSEIPPQAQLIAKAGAFRLTLGATSLQVSITPIEPPALPAVGSIAGNVYRFTVADQAGNRLNPTACDGCRTLLLRAPDGTGAASIKRFVDGGWVDIETLHAGTAGLYQVNAADMGDYAVVTGGQEPSTGVDPLILLGGGALLVWVLVVAFLVWRRTRPMPITSGAPPSARGRIPSKRKGPRRPPTGRTRP